MNRRKRKRKIYIRHMKSPLQGFRSIRKRQDFMQALAQFLKDIREDDGEAGGYCFMLCYCQGSGVINRYTARRIARKTEVAMRFLSEKTGMHCYAWLDEMAGQLRVSTKSDGNIAEKFGAKIVYEADIIQLISGIYTESDFREEESYKLKVFFVKPLVDEKLLGVIG